MKLSYYPGCTLRTQAKDLDKWGRLSLEKLGVQLEEIENWQCCGAVYPQATDEIAKKLSAIRALDAAKKNGGKLVTLCSACFNVLKRVNADMKEGGDVAKRANNYLVATGYLSGGDEYKGETEVIHYLEVLRDYVGWDKLKAAVVNPLKDMKLGAYYGCLLLRPNSVMRFDNPENPQILEDFIRAIGATPVSYALRNECCGNYVALKTPDAVKAQVDKIERNAEQAGATALVTACPSCRYNLKVNGNGRLEGVYITELLATALGIKE